MCHTFSLTMRQLEQTECVELEVILLLHDKKQLSVLLISKTLTNFLISLGENAKHQILAGTGTKWETIITLGHSVDDMISGSYDMFTFLTWQLTVLSRRHSVM